MGWFSSSKKVYVSATTYNGSVKDYHDLLPTMVTSSVVAGDDLVDGVIKGQLLQGRGVSLLTYHKLCSKPNNLYDQIGHITSTFYADASVDLEKVQANLEKVVSKEPDETISVWDVRAGVFDINRYVLALMDTKYPNISTYTVEDDGGSSGAIKYTVIDPEGNIITTGSVDGDTSEPWVLIRFNITTPILVYPEGSKEPVIEQQITKHSWYLSRPETEKLGLNYTFYESVIPLNRSIFSPIPLRRNNKWVTDTKDEKGSIYPICKDAFKRFSGSDYDTLVKNLEENIEEGSIKDIDHIFLVLGVPLNSTKPSMQKYIWEFMNNLHENWLNAGVSNTYATKTLDEWNKYGFALGGTEYVKNPNKIFNFRSKEHPVNDIERTVWYRSNKNWCYDFVISWRNSFKTTVTGKISDKAKIGDFSFKAYNKDYTYTVVVDTIHHWDEDHDWYEEVTETRVSTYEVTEFRKQISENQYEVLLFTNLTYTNTVYDGKNVAQTAKSAMSAKEEDCAFIIPLEEGTLRELPLVDRNQIANFCGSFVLNSYVIKKKKWFQKGIFGCILIVIGVICCCLQWWPLGVPLIAAGVGQLAYALILRLIMYALIPLMGRKNAEKLVQPLLQLVKIVLTIVGFFIPVCAVIAAAISAAEAGYALKQGNAMGFVQLGMSIAVSYLAFNAMNASTAGTVGNGLQPTPQGVASFETGVAAQPQGLTLGSGSPGLQVTPQGVSNFQAGIGNVGMSTIDKVIVGANIAFQSISFVSNTAFQLKQQKLQKVFEKSQLEYKEELSKYTELEQELINTNPWFKLFILGDIVEMNAYDVYLGPSSTLELPFIVIDKGIELDFAIFNIFDATLSTSPQYYT